jgi:hypothetical protein
MSEVIITRNYSTELNFRLSSHTDLHNEYTDKDSIRRASFGILDDPGYCEVKVRATYSMQPTNYKSNTDLRTDGNS